MRSKPVYRQAGFRTCLIIIFTLTFSLRAFGQKTDRVFFVNGDNLLGEIQKLERAELRVDSEYAGKVDIDWEDVSGIQSDKTCLFQIVGGDIYTGTFTFDEIGNFVIMTEDDTFALHRDDITRMITYDRKLWQRFSGNLGLGLDFSSASRVFKVNLFSGLTYRGPMYSASISYDNVFTNIISDSTKYNKRDLTLTSMRVFKKSWFIQGEYKFEQNSELGFDSRNIITASGGNNFLQTQHLDMSAAIGVNYNREAFTPTTETVQMFTNNVELPTTLRFAADHDKADVKTEAEFTYFPSMTDIGRHRFDASVSFSMEFVDDFEWGVEFYNNYDNRIPSTGMKSNDYGVISSLSYSFD